MRNIHLEIINGNVNLTKKDYFENWFAKRGLISLQYQQDILSNKLTFNGEPMVLAVSPGGGKTLMSIAAIDRYCLENPSHRVLVLTHAQTILRSQYAKELFKVKPSFSWTTIVRRIDKKDTIHQITSSQLTDCTNQVIITLPWSIRNQQIPHFDLVVIDEAHQFYFAKMNQSILEKASPSNQILLTGTPSSFVLRKYAIISVSLNDLYNYGIVCDPIIELASSTYDFTQKDYNQEMDLKKSVDIKESDTENTLSTLLKQLSEKTNSTGWFDSLKALSKTMIVCRNQQQAQQVNSFFKNEGINASLSICSTDEKSIEIKRFTTEIDCLVLIVVGRGILGFNYPELTNVIDMSCSLNPDRILQLLCRVVRKSKNNTQKLFFKVVPHNLEDNLKYVMTAVGCLTFSEYFIKFNGKNFLTIEIPVIKAPKEKKKYPRNYSKQSNDKVLYRPIEFSGLPMFSFFQKIRSENNKILNTYAYTSLRNIINCYENFNDWSKEELFSFMYEKYVANNCRTIYDLRKSFFRGYRHLVSNNLINEFIEKFEIKSLNRDWNSCTKLDNFEFIYDEYLKRKGEKDISLCNAFNKGFKYLWKNGFLNEFQTKYEVKSKITDWQSLSKEDLFKYIDKVYKKNSCQNSKSLKKAFPLGYRYLLKTKLINEFYEKTNLNPSIIRWSKYKQEEALQIFYSKFVEFNCETIADFSKRFWSGANYLYRHNLIEIFANRYNIPYKSRVNWTDKGKQTSFRMIYKQWIKHNCKKKAHLHKCFAVGYSYLQKNNLFEEFFNAYNIKL